MKNTREDFIERANAVNEGEEEQIDRICISWLRMLTMDNGKDGKTADKLLAIVEDLLRI